MKPVFTKIKRMVEEGYVHQRKGFALDKVEFPFMISQVLDEIHELEESPDDPSEMADILAILFHYCIKQGWTPELMQCLITEKLDLRFKKPRKIGARND